MVWELKHCNATDGRTLIRQVESSSVTRLDLWQMMMMMILELVENSLFLRLLELVEVHWITVSS